jgi:hypothetical protein
MSARRWIVAACFTAILQLSPAMAQQAPAMQPAAGQPAQIERLSGVWIEGPGYDIKYGATYEVCAQRCLATEKCVMIEYYRPEKKCNLYDKVRPRVPGGASDVGLRR